VRCAEPYKIAGSLATLACSRWPHTPAQEAKKIWFFTCFSSTIGYTEHMKKANKYVLRNVGTSRFARELPHDFMDDNFVEGWQNLEQRGALCFTSEAEAELAKDFDPDGDSLMVEEIQ